MQCLETNSKRSVWCYPTQTSHELARPLRRELPRMERASRQHPPQDSFKFANSAATKPKMKQMMGQIAPSVATSASNVVSD